MDVDGDFADSVEAKTAKEQIENPSRENAEGPKAKKTTVKKGQIPGSLPKSDANKAPNDILNQKERELCLAVLDELDDKTLDDFCESFREAFPGSIIVSDEIQTYEHLAFINHWHKDKKFDKTNLAVPLELD
ncbi:MAG: hypothetical protein Unbinned1819contig1001_40 [Prokaryotic dsDNA virus sp.]|nr:MAG: hypothetical protein Unbinned1819contig1001_40 [Prokaryotic dsDNA virus sp.]